MQKLAVKTSLLPRALLVLMGAALFLDIPASRAYNEHNAWTRRVGAYLFHGIQEMYGIPISFTLFEVFSYAAAALILLRWGSQRSRLWTCLGLSAVIIPLACLLATMTGVMRGNQLSLAFSQLHFVPMIPVWLVIGYYLGAQPGTLLRAARMLFWICIWRSVYGLYVFFAIYGGRMEDREYLIDHASSSFLAVGIAYAAFQAFSHRRSAEQLFGYGFATALMIWPYILNDRRTSFVGLLAAFVLLPIILPKSFLRRMGYAYRWVLVAGVVLVSYKIVLSKVRSTEALRLGVDAPLNIESLDFRQIENYNLMIGVIERPLLGLGFGTRFPQAVPLPDISFSFDLFDAIPHNTSLFLWTFAGPLGIAGLATSTTWLMLVIGRVGSLARTRQELLLASLGLVVVLQWIMYVCFDMGLLESRSSMLVGVFGGGLFPVYGRILVEQMYAKYQGTVRTAHTPGTEQPHGLSPLQWQRPEAGSARSHI